MVVLVETTHFGAEIDTSLALDELHGLLVRLRQHLEIGCAEVEAEVEL
jgi:hypothetical protein